MKSKKNQHTALDLVKVLKHWTPGDLEALFKGANQEPLQAEEIRKRIQEHIADGVKFIPLAKNIDCPAWSDKYGCPGHKQKARRLPDMKLIFIDVETTGTNFWQHGIHQLSGCIEVNGEIKADFNYQIQPNPKAKIEPEALAVSGKTLEEVMAYRPMGEIYKEFTALLGKFISKYDKADKAWFVGYNSASFDMPFVRAWFKQNGDEYFGSWFHSVSIDCIVLAAQQLMAERRDMENFKLHTVARKLGISVDDTRLHDAAYDIEITRRIYQIVTRLKPVQLSLEQLTPEAKAPEFLET